MALQDANIEVNNYFASEIDEGAIQISKNNFGDKIIRIGDVTKLDLRTLPKIDLLIGGVLVRGFQEMENV